MFSLCFEPLVRSAGGFFVVDNLSIPYYPLSPNIITISHYVIH